MARRQVAGLRVLRVARATCSCWRATSPPDYGRRAAPNRERLWCCRLGGKLPPGTARLAVPPVQLSSQNSRLSELEFPSEDSLR